MKRLMLSVLCLSAFNVYAPDTHAQEENQPVYEWKHSLIGALTLTQVSFANWTQGGENAIAWTFSIDGKSVDDRPKMNWSNSYKFAFGQTRLGDQGLRKTDDKLDLETVFTHKLGSYVNPYFAATLKTQFAEGFKYDKAGGKTAVSEFFDPAYVTQSAGAGYQPLKQIKTRFGVAVRETITRKFNVYADDPKTAEIEKIKVEIGLESVIDIEWKLHERFLVVSKLELFSKFEQPIDDLVVRNDNTISLKMSKYTTVNLNVQLINEEKSSPKTQVKQALSFGLSYSLL